MLENVDNYLNQKSAGREKIRYKLKQPIRITIIFSLTRTNTRVIVNLWCITTYKFKI